MSRLGSVGAVAHGLALSALVVAFTKRDDFGVEGAYFNRAEGADQAAYSFAPSPPMGWLIATGILLVVGTVCFVFALLARHPSCAVSKRTVLIVLAILAVIMVIAVWGLGGQSDSPTYVPSEPVSSAFFTA